MHSHNSPTKNSSDPFEIKEKWRKKMKRLLIDENENETEKIETIVCVFQVPESLREKDPEAYTPQLVALGPYRHLDPTLHRMQNYKINLGKKFLDKVQLCELIQEFEGKGEDIRESYLGAQFIWYDQLALMMIIDGLFLLAILGKYVNFNKIPDCSAFLRVLSSSGKMLHKDAILKDVLMLENQIPRFVLKEIFSKTGSDAEEDLRVLFVKFCQKISPIKVKLPEASLESREHHHLLDLLYQFITFEENGETKNLSTKRKTTEVNDLEAAGGQLDCSRFSQLRDNMSKFNNFEPVRIFSLILELCLGILGVFGVKVGTVLVEKHVLIPSVSELFNARIKIKPTEGGTRNVKFDEKTKTLHLPKITLNSTSLVVFRNLVMYETMAKPESLHFRRYAELMGAIVDTAEDLDLLMDFKVLEINKKCDMSHAEILEIFNGMTGTMRSKDDTIDEQIRETNKCYNMYPMVRMKRVMRKYVYSSWKFLAAFATLLLIMMMGLQTFCDVYSCPTVFGRTKNA